MVPLGSGQSASPARCRSRPFCTDCELFADSPQLLAWALRCATQPGPRARDRLAHPQRRNRQPVLPGSPPHRSVPRLHGLLRNGPQYRPDAAVLQIAMLTAIEKRSVAVLVIAGDPLPVYQSPPMLPLGKTSCWFVGECENREWFGGVRKPVRCFSEDGRRTIQSCGVAVNSPPIDTT